MCPNESCRFEYEKILLKCPICDIYYASDIGDQENISTDIIEVTSDKIDYSKWTPDNMYKHIALNPLSVEHEARVLDPIFGNPNSRYVIASLLHKIKKDVSINIKNKKIADITDGKNRKSSRQWTIVSADVTYCSPG